MSPAPVLLLVGIFTSEQVDHRLRLSIRACAGFAKRVTLVVVTLHNTPALPRITS